jgi:chlorophyllide a reductase subunit X
MRTRNLGGLDPALEEDLMPSQLECMVL